MKAQQEITGPLQEKIMMALRTEPLCGVDLMERLKIRSPGTIYPALDELRVKALIDYEVETEGATRRKRYFLTEKGNRRFKEHLAHSARMFCCDYSLHINKIIKNLGEIVEVAPHEKVLCTLEYDGLKRMLRGGDVTYSSDVDVPAGSFDSALSLLGVGCLMGGEAEDIKDYVGRLHRCLRRGGRLVAIEIEKTDNIFNGIFFEDIVGLKEAPGQTREDLDGILSECGFTNIKTVSRAGMLYSVSYKI
jgi:DNA-binding PadR family transcriptional regulator